MELLTLILTLLIAVLASSVVEEVTPRISLPLVQIAIGLVIVIIFPGVAKVHLEPELFLVLFIAPLLFDETRHANKMELWRNKGSILSLAIGLVLVCVLACGFALHWFEPSIPLAAAFALGAALAPTDAVAVSALGKVISISPRQKAQLSGEALLNDASGVVSFQFAIAAATTGAFSALEAGKAFAIVFFGGLLAGAILGFALRTIRRILRKNGMETTTVHVVLEVLSPFIIYLVSEHLGVSGIIAVVCAGLIMNTANNVKLSPASARLSIVSSSVWDVMVFVINGFVFVMLGMQLPLAITPTWEAGHIGTSGLLALVLGITVVTIVVRFIWVLVLDAINSRREPAVDDSDKTQTIAMPVVQAEQPEVDPFEDPIARDQRLQEQTAPQPAPTVEAPLSSKNSLVKNALITTLAGPKGAVTLSIIMSLPLTMPDGGAFPYRDMLIFIASGVILLTLLLANFALPLLAKKDHGETDLELRDIQVDILLNVIAELKHLRTDENAKATALVIRRYGSRIKTIRVNTAGQSAVHNLRREVLIAQQQAVGNAVAQKQVSIEAGRQYANKLKRLNRMMKIPMIKAFKAARAPWKRSLVAMAPKWLQRVAHKLDVDMSSMTDHEGVRTLMVLTERRAVEFLQEVEMTADDEMAHAAALLLNEHRRMLQAFEDRASGDTSKLNATDSAPIIDIQGAIKLEKTFDSTRMREVEAEGYRLELEQIQRMRESGRISRATARSMREDVYLMQMSQADSLSE